MEIVLEIADQNTKYKKDVILVQFFLDIDVIFSDHLATQYVAMAMLGSIYMLNIQPTSFFTQIATYWLECNRCSLVIFNLQKVQSLKRID